MAIDEDRIFCVRGKKVLQGIFGVIRAQDMVTALGPGLRVIMNLIPTNTYLREVVGDVSSLPMTSQWMHMVLLDGEVCWMNSEDQKASFYSVSYTHLTLPTKEEV